MPLVYLSKYRLLDFPSLATFITQTFLLPTPRPSALPDPASLDLKSTRIVCPLPRQWMMASTIPSRLTRVGWPLVRPPSFRPSLRAHIVPKISRLAAVPGILGRTTANTLFSATFLRPLHHSVSHSSACDFNSPCRCSGCMKDNRQPYCEICKVNPTAHQDAAFARDRKGISGYSFTSYCDQCWEGKTKTGKSSGSRESGDRNRATTQC